MRLSKHLIIAPFLAWCILGAENIAPAHGEARSLATGEELPLSSIETGDQFAVLQSTGTKDFADQMVDLTEFSGVFGQSSDAAYVLVAAGQAEIKGKKAKAGQILLILPYGIEIVVQRFDAQRFVESWSPQTINTHPELHSRLTEIANNQKRAIFWGLYEATDFNVTAPGSQSAELARRSVVGSSIINDIRFSAQDSQENIERQVVDAFVQALASGNSETVATLFDPTPFGGSDLRGGATGARLMLAQKLLTSYDWGPRLQDPQLTRLENSAQWRVVSGEHTTEITLIPIEDFTFVQSVNPGD